MEALEHYGRMIWERSQPILDEMLSVVLGVLEILIMHLAHFLEALVPFLRIIRELLLQITLDPVVHAAAEEGFYSALALWGGIALGAWTIFMIFLVWLAITTNRRRRRQARART